MKSFFSKNKKAFLYGGIACVVLIATEWGLFNYMLLSNRVGILDDRIADLQTVRDALFGRLADSRNDVKNLSEALSLEQGKNSIFENRIEEIASTVGKLDELSKTDPELLAKYSKVYFLNENYIPEKLLRINQKYSYNENRDIYFHARALPFLNGLIESAADDGIDLFIVSAYRSFDTQSGLKSTYSVKYGSGANTFSADQGYSEHQLGTTVDLTSRKTGAALTGFEDTPEYAWLLENAHKHGFVLSYPAGNAYYVFEPWHWRFVGVALAEHLHNEGINFYDMDQRDINEYLINLFD